MVGRCGSEYSGGKVESSQKHGRREREIERREKEGWERRIRERIKKQSWTGEESEKKREVKCRKVVQEEKEETKSRERGEGREEERTTGLPPVFLKRGPCNVCVLQLQPFASPSMFLLSRTISQIQSSKIWKCTLAFCVQLVFLESFMERNFPSTQQVWLEVCMQHWLRQKYSSQVNSQTYLMIRSLNPPL